MYSDRKFNKLDCGCIIHKTDLYIDFCPKHKSADDMYKALKVCREQLGKAPYAFKYGNGIELVDKVLKEAEGK